MSKIKKGSCVKLTGTEKEIKESYRVATTIAREIPKITEIKNAGKIGYLLEFDKTFEIEETKNIKIIVR
jgi:hypothetical protein